MDAPKILYIAPLKERGYFPIVSAMPLQSRTLDDGRIFVTDLAMRKEIEVEWIREYHIKEEESGTES
jgi:hypothetical protein